MQKEMEYLAGSNWRKDGWIQRWNITMISDGEG
jgi:hypothetical protein